MSCLRLSPPGHQLSASWPALGLCIHWHFCFVFLRQDLIYPGWPHTCYHFFVLRTFNILPLKLTIIVDHHYFAVENLFLLIQPHPVPTHHPLSILLHLTIPALVTTVLREIETVVGEIYHEPAMT